MRKVSRVTVFLRYCAVRLMTLAEVRLKSALPHIEFALAAGVKQAASPLAKVHYELYKLYQAQYKQSQSFKTI